MLSLFKKRITAEQCAGALHLITMDLRDRFLSEMFPEMVAPNASMMREELCYLGMYIIDGRIKMPSEKSWDENKESIKRYYYSKWAESSGVERDAFLWCFYDKIKFYNQGISDRMPAIATSGISRNPREQFVQVAAALGELFAEACDCPDDGQHIMVGSGACVAINTAIEGLVTKCKIMGGVGSGL